MLLKLNKRILLISAVLFILLLIPISFAADLDNETLSDDEILTAGDTIYVSNGEYQGNGSQDNPYNSVSVAVENYNSSSNSKIFIRNGEYSIDNQIELKQDITIVGESRENTILNGNSQSSIFKASSGTHITLINLTFINSNSAGAVVVDYGRSLTVDNCKFDNNSMSAIYKRDYSANSFELIIKDSVFTNNRNVGGSTGDGGAISIFGGTLLNVTNTLFENNILPTGENDATDGGAIYCGGNLKTVYIDECRFISNRAIRGSAISQQYTGNVYIYNSIFINNTSPGNNKYSINSSVIYNSQYLDKGYALYFKNNNFADNLLNNDIYSTVDVIHEDKNTKLTASNVNKIYGDDYNYVVLLTGSDGTPLSGKQITVTLTNNYDNSVINIFNITNSEGKAVFSLKNQKPGKYSAVAKFEAEEDLDESTTLNSIIIRTENQYNLIFSPNYVFLNEGDSYDVNGTIYDEYLIPTNDLSGETFAIDWIDAFGKHLYLDIKSVKIDGSKLNYDINRCHLVTSDTPYEIHFTVSTSASATLTVDLSKDFSNIDPDIKVIYVSKSGNDTTGDGSQSNPLATIQMALSANYKFGGGKTIYVDEGVYEISTFNVLGNVTVVGVKSKTILKQTAGVLGMLEIDNGNTVKLINLTFINGYATPEPESLIHVCDDSVVYIDGCEFENNSAIDGGAISVSTGGSVYVDNSYFHDNKALLNRIGGVIYVDRGYLYVANSLFENNTAGEGGAIFLGFPSEATIINSTFINNTATGSSSIAGSGGAIFTRSNNLLVENSSFIENTADYGGAIYIDYGAIYVYKSYFENNFVKHTGTDKGSAIQGAISSYCNITMHYSILISDVENNYLVYIPNLDENYTAEVNDNLWKTNGLNSNVGFTNQVKMIISTDSEFIYTGDVIEFIVEFVSMNVNGTSPLNSSVHDFDIKLIPSVGNIEDDIVIIKNNKAVFYYNATNVGEATIQAGNMFRFASIKFDVLDGSDKIKINSSVNIEAGKKTKITVNLDANINNNLTIRVNDDSYSVKVNDSKAVLEIDTLPGDYTVKVIFSGDETYKGFVNTQTFSVDKFKSILTAQDITTYYNGNFNVTLKDDEGRAISNQNVVIMINGTVYNAVTDENGVAVLELNLPSTGKYDVVSAYLGNSNYNASQANSTITVEFANVKLTAQDSVVITPIKGSFSFTLTDNNGKAIKNTKVLITFNGNSVDVTTDENGVATLNLDNNGLTVGKYDISAKVVASAVYSEANLNSSLTVIKATAILYAENITVYANSGKLTVNVTDSEGNAIGNINVTVKINSIETITTDDNGIVTLNLKLPAGNYTALISISENPIYDASVISIAIKVDENVVLINAPSIVVYYSNGKFKVYLTDIAKKPIANARIIVNINNNDYTASTDGEGVAVININQPVGTYNATVKFEGDSIFKAANTTSIINVVSSIAANDLVRAYNSAYDFKAVLKDEQGNPVNNTDVDLIVNGKTYTVKTDSDGVLLFNQKLGVGTYAITIVNPSTGEKTANYAQIVPRITGNANIKMYFGAGKYYKVRVFDDDGNPVGAGEIVKITIGSKKIDAKTDKNGYASYKITQKAKSYTITATYKGVKVSNKVVVKPVLTAKNISKKKAKTIKFSAKLVNTKGKAVKGKKITFKIKGKTYKVKTNKKGVATLKLKKLKVGKHKITTKYGKSTIKNTIKIKK